MVDPENDENLQRKKLNLARLGNLLNVETRACAKAEKSDHKPAESESSRGTVKYSQVFLCSSFLYLSLMVLISTLW